MAQHGAHVTQTLQPKPSIFEVVASDSLQATFYPALRRIVNVICEYNQSTNVYLKQFTYAQIYYVYF